MIRVFIRNSCITVFKKKGGNRVQIKKNVLLQIAASVIQPMRRRTNSTQAKKTEFILFAQTLCTAGALYMRLDNVMYMSIKTMFPAL